MPKIKVHEKALAHLSRGLYRSPASALRELVSNAWDANASTVHVSTGYPNFLQLAVQDDGFGFARQDFVQLMEGGIGNSRKRPLDEPLRYGRFVIGRLGIGMLGIAQICGTFTIVSKQEDGKGFRARVQLYDLLRQRTDEEDLNVVVMEDGASVKEVNVGEYSLEELDDADYAVGTTILTEDVHPTFSRSFQQSVEFEGFQEPPLDWERALEIVSRAERLQQLGDYWRLLWELAVSCPVPYVSKDALPNGLVTSDYERLLSYQFQVIVDGIELRKPVFLKNNPAGYTTQQISDTTKRVYGTDLTFHGYMTVQEGKQLKPDELRGILIRVKEVGIGLYDPTFLDYRVNEGPRSRWLTGEIFVGEGLEDALNIDRDSFNRFHPAFRTLQTTVHDVLQKRVFPQVYKQIDVRSAKKEKERSLQRAEYIRDILQQALGKTVVIEEHEPSDDGIQQAELSITDDKAVVKIPHPDKIRAKKTFRQLATAILAIYESSNIKSDDQERREVFRKQLFDLLSKW